jgi:hypothetical protein
MRGHAPRSRAATSGQRRPAPLDQWSRPSRRAPGARLESPVPMPSRSVRPAGNRHSCGDTPLMPRARHAGYLPGMRWAAARRSRPAASPARLRPSKSAGYFRLETVPRTSGCASRLAGRACQLIASRCTRFSRGYRPPRGRRQHAGGGYCRARQAGARAATAGLDARGRRGFRRRERSRPHGGCVRPGRPTVGWERVAGISTRDGRSGTAANNTGYGASPARRRGHRSPGRSALPRPRACGGRSCSVRGSADQEQQIVRSCGSRAFTLIRCRRRRMSQVRIA